LEGAIISMPTLSVSLFGQLSIHSGDQVLEGLEARKVQELFCYLLLHRERAHPRETLASVLWGDYSTVQSRSYLRKALWQLQAALDPQTRATGNSVVLADPEWVRLNPRCDLRLDVALFEEAATLARGTPGEKLSGESARALKEAVALYQGDLLAGWYQDWCLYERERLQQIYLNMLDKLMGYCEATHTYEQGLDYGERVLRYDRAHESTHRRLMRLHYLAGDRTAALRQYDRCVAALREELAVEPTPYTTILYEHIRVNKLDGRAFYPGVSQPPHDAVIFLPGVLDRLRQLQSKMAEFQNEVQLDIQAVEQVLFHHH
jgi:DNA-binding SARP family transcriptional activator